ncbi:hypothetical protein EB796_024796 [Bugula neritina]|uniref:EF-hand domain-containing protein n=1 Tax=Bugula neritina TaxID=10212 RepID=A0A7J7IUH1_BUGNE|nr:hypothetical protein EB796_024796 [Bugula neritina]
MSEEALSAEKISAWISSYKEMLFKISTSKIGLNPTKSECSNYKSSCASDNNLVDFSEILTLVQNLGWDRSAEEQAIINAFAEFDVEKTGYLEESLLKKKLCSLGEDQLSKHEVDKLLSLTSFHTEGGSRQINYKELSAALCGKPTP